MDILVAIVLTFFVCIISFGYMYINQRYRWERHLTRGVESLAIILEAYAKKVERTTPNNSVSERERNYS